MHAICEFDWLYVGIGAAIAHVSARFWKRFERKMVSDGKDLKNIYFSGDAFSSPPACSGSPGPGLPDAIFRMKKAPLQVG